MTQKFNFSEISILDWDETLYNQLLNIFSCSNEITHSFFAKIYNVLNKDKLIFKLRNNAYVLSEEEKKEYISKLATIKTLFIESISENNDLKFLIALVSTCFYNQEMTFLSKEKLSRNSKIRIINLLKQLNIQFGLSSKESYSDNKLVSDYNNAKENDDYANILKTMIQLSNNPHIFYSSDCSWNLLIAYIWYMDNKIIAEYLEIATYEMVELIYHALHENIFEIMNQYDYRKSNYPIIRGLNILFHKLDNDINSRNILNIKKVDCYSIMNKLDDNQKTLIQTNFKILNIEHCISYNYTMGHCCSCNINFLDFFLKNSSMRIENAYVFSQGYIANNPKIEDFCETAKKIMNSYFDLKKPNHINENVGFLDFFIKYYSLTNATKDSYLETLKGFNTKILTLQNAWISNEITKYWVSFFYCTLSNSILKYQYAESDIRQSLSVLYDERNKLIYDKYPIEYMKTMLINPDSCVTVELECLDKKESIKLTE